MLKMTGVTLEKISDPYKYMFFEQGMRVEVSYINRRYSDMNNLYGRAMRQYLPINNFKWVKNIDKVTQKLMRIKNNSPTEYVFE